MKPTIKPLLAAVFLALAGNAFAANDPSDGQCDVVKKANPSKLFPTCIQAWSASNLVEHLTSVSASDVAIGRAQAELDKAISIYATLSNGGKVPGFNKTPTVFAIAFINRDSVEGYDAAQDQLIAKYEDTNLSGKPDAGDQVITGSFPMDFNATSVGNFTQTTHETDTVCNNGIGFLANNTESWFDFGDSPSKDMYTEGVGEDYVTAIKDGVSTPNQGLTKDGLYIDPLSPSKPGTNIGTSQWQGTDDQFIDVSVNSDALAGISYCN